MHKQATPHRPRLLLILAILCCLTLLAHAEEKKKAANQNPSPMAEHIRTHERLPENFPPGKAIKIDNILDKPVELFIPDYAEKSEIDTLLVFFHGPSTVPAHAVHSSGRTIAAAALNLGFGSSSYARPFADETLFPRMVEGIEAAVSESSGRKTRFSAIFLVSFSAGYGAVRAILGQYPDRIDGVILLDSMHSNYIPSGVTLFEGGAVDGEGLSVFLDYAQKAAAGGKRFLVTHSCIFPATYASTTECAQYIIDELGLRRTPVLEWGPGGMQILGRTVSGNLKILAFAGNTAPDHVDHPHGLPDFLAMLLDN